MISEGNSLYNNACTRTSDCLTELVSDSNSSIVYIMHYSAIYSACHHFIAVTMETLPTAIIVSVVTAVALLLLGWVPLIALAVMTYR